MLNESERKTFERVLAERDAARAEAQWLREGIKVRINEAETRGDAYLAASLRTLLITSKD